MPFEFYLFLVSAFILGAVVGSFLNVCIYRIPEGLSIVSPPSSCPHCGHRIRWYENVPIVSYLFLVGRCSQCRKSISSRYPAIEALTGLLYALGLYYFGFSAATLVYWLFLSALVVITFIDLDHQIIPDIISVPGIVAGLICSLFIPWLSWFDSFLGVMFGGGLLFAIAWIYEFLTSREGMGGGDIKLLGMIGAFLGWKAILPIVFLSSLIGTLVGVPLMYFKGGDGRLALPFGPFLSMGAVFYLFWGNELMEIYFSMFVR